MKLCTKTIFSFGPLPELLRMKDGSKVKTAADWEKRKAEYLSEVIDIEYGGMPPKPEYFRLDHVCQGFGTGFDTYRITAGPEKNPITFCSPYLLPRKHRRQEQSRPLSRYSHG